MKNKTCENCQASFKPEMENQTFCMKCLNISGRIMASGWIKVLVNKQVCKTARLMGIKGYEGVGYQRVKDIKISCFELHQHETKPRNEKIILTDNEGYAYFDKLGWGWYLIRCNDDKLTECKVMINPRNWTPNIKLIGFEILSENNHKEVKNGRKN